MGTLSEEDYKSGKCFQTASKVDIPIVGKPQGTVYNLQRSLFYTSS